jgi:hypothetical protein
VFLVEGADEAALPDGKQRNGLGVLGLGAAHDNFLDATVPACNQIAVAEEKTSGANGGHVLHVGSGLADEVGVVVFDISARADAFGHMCRIHPRRKSRKKVSARAKGFHFVLHELVEALDYGRHGNDRRYSDDDAEYGQGGAHLGGAQRLDGGEEILASLSEGHNCHQSDLRATTGSRRDARNAG